MSILNVGMSHVIACNKLCQFSFCGFICIGLTNLEKCMYVIIKMHACTEHLAFLQSLNSWLHFSPLQLIIYNNQIVADDD